MTYEQACAAHRWDVPPQYNIAADVCDKHPRDKPAMVWESFDGARRELPGGATGPGQPGRAHARRARRRRAATGSRSCCRPTPETAAIFFGTWKLGAILLSMSVLYGDDGDRAPARRLGAEAARHRRRQRARFDGRRTSTRCSCSSRDAGSRRPDRPSSASTPRPTTRRSCTTRPGTTGQAKGIVHAHRYLLAHEEFVYCHEVAGRRAVPRDGRVGLGRGDRAAARPVAARRGAVRATSARPASTRTGSSTSSAATRSRTSSRPRPRCAR